MKYFISILVVGILLLLAPITKAGTYPSSDGVNPIKLDGCTLVNNQEEADSTHVYTLNPDNTIKIAEAYLKYWGRPARCSELQFHVDHNTPISRLNSWLNSVVISWYKNIGSTHFEGKTVSTSNYEWFLIKGGVAHRIPDVLTGWSWGLLVDDRLSIPYQNTTAFYDSITIGPPLNFSDGQYTDKIHEIWKNKYRVYSSLPSRMADTIEKFVNDTWAGSMGGGIFERCNYSARYPGDPYAKLLDWSWMLRNPGCALGS